MTMKWTMPHHLLLQQMMLFHFLSITRTTIFVRHNFFAFALAF